MFYEKVCYIVGLHQIFRKLLFNLKINKKMKKGSARKVQYVRNDYFLLEIRGKSWLVDPSGVAGREDKIVARVVCKREGLAFTWKPLPPVKVKDIIDINGFLKDIPGASLPSICNFDDILHEGYSFFGIAKAFASQGNIKILLRDEIYGYYFTFNINDDKKTWSVETVLKTSSEEVFIFPIYDVRKMKIENP